MSAKPSWAEVLTITLVPAIMNMAISSAVVSLATPSVVTSWAEATYQIALAQYRYGIFVWSGLAVLFAVLTILLAREEGDPVSNYMRLPEETRGKLLDVLLALGLAAFGYLLLSVLFPLALEATTPPESMCAFYRATRNAPLYAKLYLITAGALAAGVCEEIVWRSYAITRMERLMGGSRLKPIVLLAILFGIWHGLSLHALFCAVYGLVAGYIFARTRRLPSLMAGHWLTDVLGSITLFWLAR